MHLDSSRPTSAVCTRAPPPPRVCSPASYTCEVPRALGPEGFLPSQANWWTARRTFAPDPAESDRPTSPAELAECFPPAKVCASLV